MAAKTYDSLHYIRQYDLDDVDVSKVFGYCFCVALNLFVHIKPSLKSFIMAYKKF